MPVGGSVETDGCAGCRELGEQLAAALARVEQLEGLLEASRRLTAGLNQRLEELEAQAHRPAARFRVPESRRKPSKAKPGRKRGHLPTTGPELRGAGGRMHRPPARTTSAAARTVTAHPHRHPRPYPNTTPGRPTDTSERHNHQCRAYRRDPGAAQVPALQWH